MQKQSSSNTYEMINRKINYKNKKNSFFSENNQLLKNKIFKHNLKYLNIILMIARNM